MSGPSAPTSLSLLERVRHGRDEAAWRRLVDLYTPLIRRWLGRPGLQPADADDLTQQVLQVVVRKVGDFAHNGRPGAFRAWLRAIVVNHLRHFDRQAEAARPGWADLLDQLADPGSDLNREWDRDHDRAVLARLLDLVQGDFTQATWQAFRRLTFDEAPAREVAAELGLSVPAVLMSKSRVLNRLRQEGQDFVE